jgi:hypothetical protein
MSPWLLQSLPCPKKTKKKIKIVIEKNVARSGSLLQCWLPFAMASQYHSREENMHDFRCWDAPWWVIGDKFAPV